LIHLTTQKRNKDQKGPNTASPRAAIVIPHPERVKQWSERPVAVVVVLVVFRPMVVVVMVVVVVVVVVVV
jgi:hypothetical protein